MANRTAGSDAIKVRRAKAIKMRVDGRMTVQQIADELGVSVGTAWNDIQAAIAQEAEGLEDTIKVARALENLRYDKWMDRVLTALESTSDNDEISKLTGVLVRIAERRAKLLGLDAPIRQEIDATIGSAPQTAASARALMQSMFATNPDLGLAARDDDEPN